MELYCIYGVKWQYWIFPSLDECQAQKIVARGQNKVNSEGKQFQYCLHVLKCMLIISGRYYKQKF